MNSDRNPTLEDFTLKNAVQPSKNELLHFDKKFTVQNSNNQKFIEMCSRNSSLRHPFPIKDQPILVFDIDYCLYQSIEMAEHESTFIKKSFLDLSKSSEEEWASHQNTFNLYREIFHAMFDIPPSVFSTTFEIPSIHNFIKPDSELREILEKMPLRKVCFTNACKVRANHILTYLQLDHIFDVVICADTQETEFICKPMNKAYEFLMNYMGIEDPKNVHFFDDSEKNILGARRIGWNATHVTGDIKKHLKEINLNK